MDIRRRLAFAIALALAAAPVAAQPHSEAPSVALLARGHLDGVAVLPVYLRLYRVYVPAAHHASYRGASAMLYDLSGAATIDTEGTATQPLAEGAGAFVAVDQQITINAAESEPTNLLLFVLTARPNQKPPLDRPAITKEVYRTGDPLPGLQAGAYDFTLARLIFPAGMAANPPHYRTGAALNYILAGAGSVIADGKTEPMPAGSAQVSPAGWFHQWANPGDTPLVILRAEITQEGAAPVVPDPAK